jgi:hypothetical protein
MFEVFVLPMLNTYENGDLVIDKSAKLEIIWPSWLGLVC